MRSFLRLVRPYRGWMAGLVALGVVASLFETIGVSLLIPVLQMLSATAGGPSATAAHPMLEVLSRPFVGIPAERRLQVMVAAMLGLILVKNAVAYTLAIATATVRMRLERRLSLGVFDQLMRVGYQFIAERPAGEFLAHLRIQPKQAGLALQGMIQIFESLCLIIAYTLLLLAISWPMTLVAVAFLLALTWVLRWPARAARALGQRTTGLINRFEQTNAELVGAMRLIRAFGREPFERRRYQDRLCEMDAVQARAARLTNLPVPFAEVVSVAFLGIGLLAAAPAIISRQTVVVPLLLTFLFVLYRLLPRVAYLNARRVNVALLLPAAEAVARMLEKGDKPYLTSGTRPFARLGRGIRCERVGFTYSAIAQPVLHDLTLEIPAGRTTAVVGLSGVGKSTLVDLLLRFYDPDQGAVLIDGVDLRELDLAQWRASIGVVAQDPFLFHATVRENIAYGKLEATDEAVRGAARAAHAHEFILALPQGYETVIGDRGVRLSAGQRQRLAIARAVLRDPQLLILDEATSALDSESERQVQRALEAVRAERTVLMIAHRLSTVAHADHIVVLRDGRVVERGTHADLLAQGQAYAAFWRLQSGEPAAVGALP